MGRRVSISSPHQPSAQVIDRVLRDIGGKNAAVLTRKEEVEGWRLATLSDGYFLISKYVPLKIEWVVG